MDADNDGAAGDGMHFFDAFGVSFTVDDVDGGEGFFREEIFQEMAAESFTVASVELLHEHCSLLSCIGILDGDEAALLREGKIEVANTRNFAGFYACLMQYIDKCLFNGGFAGSNATCEHKNAMIEFCTIGGRRIKFTERPGTWHTGHSLPVSR